MIAGNFGSFTDIRRVKIDVGFTPESGLQSEYWARLLRAKSGYKQTFTLDIDRVKTYVG